MFNNFENSSYLFIEGVGSKYNEIVLMNIRIHKKKLKFITFLRYVNANQNLRRKFIK